MKLSTRTLAAAVMVASTILAVSVPTTLVLTRPHDVGAALVEVRGDRPSASGERPQVFEDAVNDGRSARERALGGSQGQSPQGQSPPEPTAVTIPSVGISAAVVPTGVLPDGQMAVPPGGGEAGWYRYGPAVGAAQGSAVIAAHVATPQGRGAFHRLRDVAVGDRVAIVRSDGTTLGYRVTGRSTWAKPSLPVSEVFRPDGDPRLTLVTCGGSFDRATGRYTDNVVVTAVPVQV